MRKRHDVRRDGSCLSVFTFFYILPCHWEQNPTKKICFFLYSFWSKIPQKKAKNGCVANFGTSSVIFFGANRYPLSPNIFRDFRIVVKRIGACGGQSLRTLKGTGVTALPEKICEKTILIIFFCLELYSQKTIIRLFGGTSFPEKI